MRNCRGVGWWSGGPSGGGRGWNDDDNYDNNDDDGEGLHCDMMILTLHFMVDYHFMIQIVSLDNVSLLWLGILVNFPPICTKASLMVLDDCWIIWINLSSSVEDKDILFIELMHLPKASDLLSQRWTFLVAFLFPVTFFASSLSIIFSSTCLYCATLKAVRYIPEVYS